MSALRDFLVNVVSADRSKPQDQNGPTGEAEIKDRLAALVGPYKEAVSRNGPAAAELKSLMAEVKQNVAQQDFERAGKIFDELEPLVERSRTPNLDGPTTDGAAQAFDAPAAPVGDAALKVRGGAPETGLIEGVEDEDEKDEPSTGFPRRMPSDASKTLEKVDKELAESYDRAFRSELLLVQKRDELKDAMKKIPKDDDYTFKKDLDNRIKPELAEKANNLHHMQVDMKAINLQLSTVHQLMATFKQQQDATFAKIEAEELLKEADELRAKANEMKEKAKLFNDLIELTMKVTAAATAPETEVVTFSGRLAEAFHTTNDLAEDFHKGIHATIQELEQKADENVKKAHKVRLDALKKEANAFEETRRSLGEVFAALIGAIDESLADVKRARMFFEENYDSNGTSLFKFGPLVKVIGLASNILTKFVPEVRKTTDVFFGRYYQIRKTRSVPDAIKEDVFAWRRESNDIRRWTEEQQEDSTNFREAVTAAIATSHDGPSEK